MAKARDDNFRLLGSMIEDIEIAMLVTRSRDGHYVSRPVATQKAEFDGDLWFFTSAASHKAAEIKAHPQVNVSYASQDSNTYVSVSGTATVRRDRSKIDALWSDVLKVYFPNGKDDPDVTLIRVKVDTAEYWDGPGSLAGKALSFVLAAVTQDADAMGDNRTLQLDRGRGKAKVVSPSTRGAAARVQKARKAASRKPAAKKTPAVKSPPKKGARSRRR
jgi:general stress protein 26